MKISCFGSRVSCSFRKALRAAATSGRSCSAACTLFFRVFVKSCGWILAKNAGEVSEYRQHAGEYFEPKVLFVAQAVRASLDDADFVVEPFDEAQRDFVLRFAVGGDSIPMAINHVGELLVGLQSLPLERGAPVLEENAAPSLRARSSRVGQRTP